MIKTFLLVFCFLLMLAGMAGIILPILPGTILIFAGALIYAIFTNFEKITVNLTIILGILTLLTLLTDYLSSSLGAKKYGASKWGAFGAFIGGIIGIFLASTTGLIPIILFPILGTILAELLSGKERKQIIKASFGTLIGFIFGSFFKIVIAIIMIGLFIKALI